ncbi:MAG TPA: hypothetical protein VMR37_02900 [Rhabdochlamydiaceae bacterium]|jgi:hypothetical protein|nr:hypothetical protein [Rhabdochlamydiaceae bacterium]
MLPLTARVQVKDRQGKGLNLWLPLFLLWPVLAVLFILCLPLLFLARGLLRRNKMPKILPLLSGLLGLLAALRGLIVDVEDNNTKVKIIIN